MRILSSILAVTLAVILLSGCNNTKEIMAANKAQTDSAMGLMALRETNKKPIAEITTVIPKGFVNNSGEDIVTTVKVWPQDELLWQEAIQLANYEIFDPLWLRVTDRVLPAATAVGLFWMGQEYNYKNNKLAYDQKRYDSERQWNFMDGTFAPTEETTIEGEGFEPVDLIVQPVE